MKDYIVKPIFKFLNDDQIDTILKKSYFICQEVGQKVYSKEALKIFESSGCLVKDNLVKIPKDIINAALNSVPGGFKLYSRDKDYFLDIKGRNSFFGTGVTTPNIIDIYTKERRPFLLADIELSAKIAGQLDNIDFVMPLGYISDKRAEVADVYHFLYTVKNTKKPIPFICYDKYGLESIIEIASEIRGSLENLQKNPFLIAYCQSTPALMHEKNALENLITSVRYDIPVIYYSAPIIGSSSPCTYAGAIIQSIAEDLIGIVLSQLVKEGSTIISGMAPHPMDFKTGNISVGAPEFSIGICAVAGIFQKLNIPTWGCAGLSDSKLFDEQSAIENCFSTIFNLLSGNNLIHDQGYLEGGMVGSIANIVMGDEIIGMAKRIFNGLIINEETLATNLIELLGPGASYLQEMHTFNNFKKEYWFPKLMDKNMYNNWNNNGSKSLEDRAFKKAQELNDINNEYQLENKIFEKLLEIKEKWEKYRLSLY